MVKSLINSKISYEEIKEINPDDIDYTATVYILHIFDIDIPIVLGKMKYHPLNNKLAYYPIYLVSNDEIRSQIGVYEFIADRALTLLDDDGDIDLDKIGDPLLFSFANNRKYLLSADSNIHQYLQQNLNNISDKNDESKLKETNEEANEETNEETNEEANEYSDEEYDKDIDILKLKVSKSSIEKTKQKNNDLLQDGIFEIQKKYPKIQLDEEDEKDAEENHKEYHLSSGNYWIENFMKNNMFRIETLGKDKKKIESLYSLVVNSFTEIGHYTTNEKLKASIVAEIDDEIYQNERLEYSLFCTKKNEIKKKKDGLKKTIELYKTELQKKGGSINLQKKKHLIQEGQESIKLFNENVKYSKQISNYCNRLQNVGDRLESFKELIQSGKYLSYPLISILEKNIHCKFLFFVETHYNCKSYDAILYCGDFDTMTNLQPKYYIMISISTIDWNECIFSQITYKNKKIFEFKELPYDVRILIVNKCLELQSGELYKFQDVRNFKTKLGLDADVGNRELFLQNVDEQIEENNLNVNKNSILMIGEKINSSIFAGKGFGEKLLANERINYLELYFAKDWRKILDDNYVMGNGEACFKLDGLKWASVSHYLFATKFYNGFRNFYKKFSLDEGGISELANNVEFAKNVADLKNKKPKYADIRPKGIHIDEDYEITGNRGENARKEALVAKFTQNLEFKKMLLDTQNSLLFLFCRRKSPILDVQLMLLRQSFKNLSIKQ